MRDHLFMYLNGEPLRIRGEVAFRTLAGFLRADRHATGTKIVCDEGDCGACTVLVGREEGERIVYRPINACIHQVYQLDCAHVVTVEGLSRNGALSAIQGLSGNRALSAAEGLTGNGALSAIQERMITHHGAQCGFCTPGFVTALAGVFEDRDRVTDADIRDGLTGNLCRCTGYDPITRAALAVDPTDVPRLNDIYPPEEIRRGFARFAGEPVVMEAAGRAFMSPVSVHEAAQYKAEGAVIVQGGTDVGVWCNKRDFAPQSVLSLRQIPGMTDLAVRGQVLEVGGSVTLHTLESYVRTLVPAFYDMLRLFGSPQIRHAATLAGNIANASPIADTLPFLYVMEAEVELTGAAGSRRVGVRSLFKGYKSLDMAPDELITRVLIPLPREAQTLRLYKVSKRRDLDISTFTAAFLMTLEGDRIESIRIAYGGVGPVVLRLPRTEEWLSGRPFLPETLAEAGRLAQEEITPISDVRGSRDFRLLLAETILQKFYHEFRGEVVSQVAEVRP